MIRRALKDLLFIAAAIPVLYVAFHVFVLAASLLIIVVHYG